MEERGFMQNGWDEYSDHFRISTDFYSETESLRTRVEWFQGPNEDEAEVALLAGQAVDPDERYSAAAILGEVLLGRLLRHLRVWGRANIGAPHVSTPTIVRYCSSPRFTVLEERSPAPWCYLLTLGPRNVAASHLTFYLPSSDIGAGQAVVIPQLFNYFTVFRSNLRYQVSTPLDIAQLGGIGTVSLKGYMW